MRKDLTASISRSLQALNGHRAFRFLHFLAIPIFAFYAAFRIGSGEASVGWTELSICVLGFLAIDSFGLQIGSHKIFSHRVCDVSDSSAAVLGVLGILGGQGSSIVWAALHSGAHHRFTDREGDPHTPNDGFFHSFLSWQLKVKSFPMASVRYLAQYPSLVFLHRYHTAIFWGVWLAAWVVIGFDKFFWLLVVPCFLSLIINGWMSYLLHRKETGIADWIFWTYRSFESNDQTKNSVVLGWLTFGTGFHNNHHAHPHMRDYGVRWYEIDCSRFFLPLLEKKAALNARG